MYAQHLVLAQQLFMQGFYGTIGVLYHFASYPILSFQINLNFTTLNGIV